MNARWIVAGSILLLVCVGVVSAENVIVQKSTPFAAETLIYAVNPASSIRELISINPYTAQIKTVVELSDLTGIGSPALAFSPDGKLIGVDASNGYLYEVNLTTGEVKHIGNYNPTLKHIPGIAFDEKGNLYGIDSENDQLVLIDPSTGATKVIGELGVDIRHTGLAVDFRTDELYAIAGGWDGEPDLLLKVDKETGKATIVGSLGVDYDAVGVEFEPYTNELFAIRDYNVLMKINLSNGKATQVAVLEDTSFYNLAAKHRKVIWKIGKFDGSDEISGSMEFEAGTDFFEVYNYDVDTNPDDEIFAPNFPGYLHTAPLFTVDPYRHQIWTAEEININFRLNHAFENVVLAYGRYGSETDEILLDGKLVTTVTGVGEGVFKLFLIPLGKLNPGTCLLYTSPSPRDRG